MFDLHGYIGARARARGRRACSRICGLDTYADEARFFSYRRRTHRGEAGLRPARLGDRARHRLKTTYGFLRVELHSRHSIDPVEYRLISTNSLNLSRRQRFSRKYNLADVAGPAKTPRNVVTDSKIIGVTNRARGRN